MQFEVLGTCDKIEIDSELFKKLEEHAQRSQAYASFFTIRKLITKIYLDPENITLALRNLDTFVPSFIMHHCLEHGMDYTADVQELKQSLGYGVAHNGLLRTIKDIPRDLQTEQS